MINTASVRSSPAIAPPPVSSSARWCGRLAARLPIGSAAFACSPIIYVDRRLRARRSRVSACPMPGRRSRSSSSACCALGMGNGAVFQLVPQRFGSEIGVMTGLVGMTGGVGGFYLASSLGYSKQFTGSYQAASCCSPDWPSWRSSG